VSHVRFTRPDGGPCEINPDNVDDVQPVRPGIYHPSAKTLIVAGGAPQVVTEAFEDVCRKLGWA
jgi:hypothetical protein